MADVALPSIYKNIQAPAGTDPADAQQAKDQMAITYGPQESTITSTINQLNQVLGQDIQGQQQFGQVADQRISSIGNNLAQQLQGNVGAIGDIFQKGQGQVGAAYDEEAKTLGDAGASIQSGLTARAKALGQSQALAPDVYGTDPLARLSGSLALLQGRAAVDKASSVSNMAQLGSSLQSIAQKAVGDSQANYAQKRADIATDVLKTIGQLKVQTNQKTGDLLQKFSDLAAQEGPAFRQILNQVTSARTSAERQVALDNINTQLKMMDLSIKQQTASAANDPNSLSNQLKQAQLIGANYTNATNAAKPTSIGDAEGNTRLTTFLNALRNDPEVKLPGTQAAGIANFINQNASTAAAMKESPYQFLVGLAQQNAAGNKGLVKLPKSSGSKYPDSDYQVPLGVLLSALDARFTNVGSALKIGTKVR